MAGACSEPDDLGEAQRAVVVEPGALPVRPCTGVLPPQVVLAPAPAARRDAKLGRRGPQRVELLGGALRVAIGVEAGMEAELVTALVDARHERPDPGVRQ